MFSAGKSSVNTLNIKFYLLCAFEQMATRISFAKSKRPRILTCQNSRPVTEREIAKRSYQDCCAGSPWDGRWPLTSSLSWKAERGRRKFTRDLWNETFHHLAGLSIIQDFEHMVDKECEIEHGKVECPNIKTIQLACIFDQIPLSFLVGSGRRYQLYAIHTSKACNILSKYTAFVAYRSGQQWIFTHLHWVQPSR